YVILHHLEAMSSAEPEGCKRIFRCVAACATMRYQAWIGPLRPGLRHCRCSVDAKKTLLQGTPAILSLLWSASAVRVVVNCIKFLRTALFFIILAILIAFFDVTVLRTPPGPQ